MSLANVERSNWISFLQKYKSFPELWDSQNVVHKNRAIRQKAWDELLINFQILIDPNATLHSLRKKICNMRTSCKREIRRLQLKGNKSLYMPSKCRLWYFKHLDFIPEIQNDQHETISIDDEETDTLDFKNIKQEGDINVQHDRKLIRIKPSSQLRNFDYVLDNLDQETVTDMHTQAKRKKPSGDLQLEEDFTKRVMTYLENLHTNDKDEATIFADTWAHSFRKLTEQQKIFAKKSIDDILALGQLRQLTFNCFSNSLLNPTPTYVLTHPFVNENVNTVDASCSSSVDTAPHTTAE